MNRYLAGAIIMGIMILATAIICLWIGFITGGMEYLKSMFIDEWKQMMLIFAPWLTLLYFVIVFAKR